MVSYESFNGVTFSGSECPGHYFMNWQSIASDWFSPSPFSGEDYSSAFTGGFSQVAEPTGVGVAMPSLWMPAYFNGFTLAESGFMGIGSFVAYAYGKYINPIGDPLMRLRDDTKKPTGGICSRDNECIGENCDADLTGIKRCHINPSLCVLRDFETILEPQKYSVQFPQIESFYEQKYCISQTERKICINGEWKEEIRCSRNTSCVDGECKKISGITCINGEECAGGFCDEDVYGIKRCHNNRIRCVIDETGEERDRSSFYCIDSNTKKVCNSGVWQDDINISMCLEPQFKYTFNFEANKKYLITLPLRPNSNFIKDIFSSLPIGAFLHKWNSSSPGWDGYVKSGKTGWPQTIQIFAREGFVIETPVQSSLVIFGNEIGLGTADISGGLSVIGMPKCNQLYTANKILEEINLLGGNCTEIFRWDVDTQAYVNNTPDFNITDYEGYVISCSEDTNLLWTPKCEVPCTETNWNFTISPLTCPSLAYQTRTWEKIGQCTSGITHPDSEIIPCFYQAPTCSGFTYSNWAPITCPSSGVQTRTVLTSSPANCEGGNPQISQTCTYIPPCEIACTDSSCPERCKSLTGEIEDSKIKNKIKVKINGNLNLNKKLNSRANISLEYSNKKLVDFDYDFSKGNINLSKISINMFSRTGKAGLIISGVSNATKTFYLNKTQNTNAVCIKDKELNSANEISSDCNSADEVLIICPGKSGKYSCSFEDGLVVVRGLGHSGVLTQELECTEDSDCEADFYSDNFCFNDAIYKNLTDYSCIDYSCSSSTTMKIVIACAVDCLNGVCDSQPSPPVIYINSPLNIPYNVSFIPLNVTANQLVTNWTYVINNQSPVSFTPNITLNFSRGANTIRVSAGNSKGSAYVLTQFYVNITEEELQTQDVQEGESTGGGGSGGGSSSSTFKKTINTPTNKTGEAIKDSDEVQKVENDTTQEILTSQKEKVKKILVWLSVALIILIILTIITYQIFKKQPKVQYPITGKTFINPTKF